MQFAELNRDDANTVSQRPKPEKLSGQLPEKMSAASHMASRLVRRFAGRRSVVFGLVLLAVLGAVPLLVLGTPPGQRAVERLIEAPLLARLEASAPAPFVLDVDDLRTTVGGATLRVQLVGAVLSAPGLSLELEDVSVRVRYVDVLRRNLVPERIEIERVFASVDDLEPVRTLGQLGGGSGFGFQSRPVAAIDDFGALAPDQPEGDTSPSDVLASLALDGLLNAFDALDQALTNITRGATWQSLQTISVGEVRIDPRAQSQVPLLRNPEPFTIAIERASSREMIARVTSLERNDPLSLIVRHAESSMPEGPAALAQMAGAQISEDNAYSHVLIRGVQTSDITGALQGDGPIQFESPLAAEFVVTRQANGVGVEQVVALFESEAGYLVAGERTATILEFASIPMIYTRETGRFDIISASLVFQDTGGVFNGTVKPAFRDGRPGLDLTLVSDDYRLAVPAEPALDRDEQRASADVRIEAFIADSGQIIDVALAEIAIGEVRVAHAGRADLRGEAPILTLVGRSTPMRVSHLAALWPLPLSPPARDWFLENVAEGSVGEADFTFAARLDEIEVRDGRTFLRDDMMNLSVPFENMVLRTVGDLPMVFGLDGSLNITGRTLQMIGEGGVGRLQTGETIEVARALFSIPDHAQRHPQAVLELELAGPAAGFASMVKLDPILLGEDVPFEPETLTGEVNLTTRIATRLSDDIDRENVRASTAAQVTGFGSTLLVDGRELSGGTFAFEADETGVRITGSARVDGVETQLNYDSTDLDGLQLAMRLDERERTRLGLDFGDYVRGTIGVDIGEQQADGRRAFTIDLTPAALSIPELGWNKPAGVTGRASFDLFEEGGERRVRNLVVAADGLSVRGSLDFIDGDLRLAEFDSAAIEGVGRFSLQLTRNSETTAARVQGERLILTADLLRGNREAAGALSLDIQVDELVSAGGAVLSDVLLQYAQTGSRVTAFDLSARLPQGGTLLGTIGEQEGQERLILSSQDAGELLRFFGLYDRARGGRALVLLDPSSVGGRVVGDMLLRDFQIVEEPAMARIFNDGARQAQEGSSIVLPGEFETSDRIDIQVTNISFDRTAERLVIHKAEGWGPSLGGNIQGIINYAADETRMRGTFVPAFSINNIFSRIPLLGQALGGRESEGLLGITFELAGTVDSPELRVNPISILAPGVFRDLFEFQQGG